MCSTIFSAFFPQAANVSASFSANTTRVSQMFPQVFLREHDMCFHNVFHKRDQSFHICFRKFFAKTTDFLQIFPQVCPQTSVRLETKSAEYLFGLDPNGVEKRVRSEPKSVEKTARCRPQTCGKQCLFRAESCGKPCLKLLKRLFAPRLAKTFISCSYKGS